jgi:nucleotide-binding universal stress UspA family protein
VVMGAYGHSRLKEWILGGSTRHVLLQMAVPVLMGH